MHEGREELAGQIDLLSFWYGGFSLVGCGSWSAKKYIRLLAKLDLTQAMGRICRVQYNYTLGIHVICSFACCFPLPLFRVTHEQ